MAGKLVIGRMTVPWVAKHVDWADAIEPKPATATAAKAAIIEVAICNCTQMNVVKDSSSDSSLKRARLPGGHPRAASGGAL